MSISVAHGPATDRALASLAVLNVNWHANSQSYLDGFVPFVVAAVRAQGLTQFDEEVARAAVADEFSLLLPSAVTAAIVRRAIKRGFASRLSGGDAQLAESATDQLNLKAEQSRLLREQGDLENALVSFAVDRFALEWTLPEASKALLAYIEDSSARVIVANYKGATPHESFASKEYERVVLASFIHEIWTSDPARFEYFLNVAKGSFLATTLFFQNHFDQERKFRGTTLYLDTGVLLAALGYEGTVRQEAALEWMKVAQSQGARLATFDRTATEAKGVLRNAVDTVKRGRGWQGRPGSVTAFFYDLSTSAGTLAAETASFDNRLSKLRVEVHALPDPDRRRHLQVDEEEVEESLNAGSFPYLSENALRHDSRVLGAILMTRNRGAQDRFEDSKAVFVTSNFRVVRAARTVPDLEREPWPVAMHVNDVAVLLWIKHGPGNSDLPAKQLLASCLAILRPSEATWANYVREIEQLEARGTVADADIALIAQQNEQDSANLIESISRGGIITLRTADDLLESARAAITEPVEAAAQAKIQELESSLAHSESERLLAAAELNAIHSDKEAKVRARASALTWLLFLIVAIVIVVGASIAWQLMKQDFAFVIGGAGLVLQIVSMGARVNGRSNFDRVSEKFFQRMNRN